MTPDNFNSDLFQKWLTQALEPLERCALLTPNGNVAAIHYQTLTDIGTLPIAAQLSNQYLKLNDGDIALTNDPFSGGSVLNSLSLIAGIRFGQQKPSADPCLLAVRITLKPKLQISEHIDKEGVRIPPTPIVQNGVVNSEIINAISNHPLTPKELPEVLNQSLEKLQSVLQTLKLTDRVMKWKWDRNFLKNLFASSRNHFLDRLSELPSGEIQDDFTLDTGERIRLKLGVHEDKVSFDFTGSQASKYVHLTDSATFGTCVGTIVAVLGGKIPLDSGIFDAFEVITPKGTLVNAEYPKPVFAGMTDGAVLIANFILRTMGKMDKDKQLPHSGISHCAYSLVFEDGSYFFDTLEPGQGALPNKDGLGGIGLWRRRRLQPSVEEIEKRYPITIKNTSIRSGSGGSGHFVGGDGLSRTIQINAPCHFQWQMIQGHQKPEGWAGGKSANHADVIVQSANSKDKRNMESVGQLELQPGDTITIQSSGGGGYGEVSADS